MTATAKHRRNSHLREYRESAAYRRSNTAYDLVQLLVAAWKKGRQPSARVLALVGVASLQEFIELMQAKCRFKLDLFSYGKTWCFDHIRPLASFDFNEPEQRGEAVHHSNIRPTSILANGRKGRLWICPEKNPALFPGL
jgi:hypothetical protein